MGKKSLTKSTSKKKTTKKKSPATKAASAKKDTAKSADKKSASKKSSPKKGASKKPTLKSLRKKDFGSWKPETLYTAEPEAGRFTAPPAVDPGEEKTAEKLRELLFKQFDPGLSEKAPAAKPKKGSKKAAAGKNEKAPAAASAKKPAASRKPAQKAPAREELIKRSFGTWSPETLFEPVSEEGSFASPPIADNSDADGFRKLLFREFDLSQVEPRAPEEPEEAPPAEAEAVATPQETISEPEPSEKAPEPAAPAAETAAAEPPSQTGLKASEPSETESASKEKAEKPKKQKQQPDKTARPAAGKQDKPKMPAQPPSDSGKEPPLPPGPGGPQEPPREPMSGGLKALIIGLAVIFGLIIIASFLNAGKYYVKTTGEGVEIWKGDFSPRGLDKLASLEGVKAPEGIEGRVSREAAYALPYDYYMTQARKLSDSEEVPNYEAIREMLTKARKYAVTHRQMQQVESRLKYIEFTLLLNKADMAMGEETRRGYQQALEYLEKAREFAATPSQKELVAKQIKEVRKEYNPEEIPPALRKKGVHEPPSPEQEQGDEEKKGKKKEAVL
jgi:hypothetical protein